MPTEVEHLEAEIKRLNDIINRSQLREDDLTFKDLFDNSSDLIYIHDENGVFIDVNQAVVDKYGYSKDEVIGQTPLLFSAPDMNDLEDVLHKTQQVWEGGKPQMIEWWSMKRNKEIFLKELILRKGKYFGRDVIIATGRDITERKEVENKLLQKNEELKKLNEALDAFVYSASHDLKAPLLSIRGLINLMAVDDTTDRKYYLERISMAVEKLTSFVSDLVEYSRNTRTEVKSEKIDFAQLVEEVFHNFEFLPEHENVRKIIDIDPIEDFHSDRYRLYIILNNLISNGIRYGDRKKADPFLRVSVKKEGNEAIITVEDNGIGIAKGHLNKIFDMFYRATDAQTGSGLGLYIVKETLLKLKGKINYSSTLNEGTSFEITIPDLKA